MLRAAQLLSKSLRKGKVITTMNAHNMIRFDKIESKYMDMLNTLDADIEKVCFNIVHW